MDRSQNGNTSDGAVKYDAGKPAYHLIDMEFASEVIEPMRSAKRGRPELALRNWARGGGESLADAFASTVELYGTDNPRHVAELELARVLGAGARKYAPNNWREGFHWSRLSRAANSHIKKHRCGEVIDDEFGLMHLSHALCMIMFLHVHVRDGLGTDDRADIWPQAAAF